MPQRRQTHPSLEVLALEGKPGDIGRRIPDHALEVTVLPAMQQHTTQVGRESRSVGVNGATHAAGRFPLASLLHGLFPVHTVPGGVVTPCVSL